MKKKYLNKLGHKISRVQSEILTEYSIEYYDGQDVLEKSENYFQSELTSVKLCNNLSLAHQDILSQNPYAGYERFVVDIQTVFENFRLEKGTTYNENDVQVGRANSLLDSNGNILGNEIFFDFDINSYFSFTMKRFMDLSSAPNREIFHVNFNNDTCLVESFHFSEERNDISGQSSFVLEPNEIDRLIELTGISPELAEYYTYHQIIPQVLT